MAVYKFYKEIGETPLLCLNRLRNKENIAKDIPITYAGRLDPAATGEMIFLTGDDCKDKNKYTGLDKTYDVCFVVGLSTDTSDLLGIIKDTNFTFDQKQISPDNLLDIFKKLSGQRSQKFHNFSSKNILGKPLWQHSREGTKIDASHIINIYDIKLLSIKEIELNKIYEKVETITNLVQGDFRQKEIINSWQEIKNQDSKLPLLNIKMFCSSGTYVRVLIDEISEILNLPICVYSINRDKILND